MNFLLIILNLSLVAGINRFQAFARHHSGTNKVERSTAVSRSDVRRRLFNRYHDQPGMAKKPTKLTAAKLQLKFSKFCNIRNCKKCEKVVAARIGTVYRYCKILVSSPCCPKTKLMYGF